ncbi:unnamed protein product [Brassica napus]|uniref:(rape) hypothetical protein n=1 Tax=Brassica napus TaxID=3708 RepID=A0A816LXA5_BRANA|nr:unnamed protein product [Brassica napus]
METKIPIRLNIFDPETYFWKTYERLLEDSWKTYGKRLEDLWKTLI